jgi:hypothetical protein
MDKIALANRFEGFSKVFAENTPISVDLKAMSSALKGMSDEKFASIVNADYEKEAATGFFPGMQSGPSSPSFNRPQPAIGGPKNVPTDPAFEFPNQGKLTQIATQTGVPVEKLQKILSLFNPASAKLASEEKTSSEKTSEGKDSWTKEAFDHIANNLVRDIVGMNKTQIENTGRHLDKKQMPDAAKAPELKNVRPTEQDTGRALTPEQVPSQEEYLNSDMYKKSKGAVRKEAAAPAADEDKAEKPQAEDKVKQDASGSDKDAAKKTDVKRLEDLEKAKKDKEVEDKKKKLEENKIKSDKKEEVESSMIEGISFEPLPDEVDMNDPEIKKLSSLFE